MSRELASYEGLVCRTAQLVAGYPHVQEDEEDIRQLLRIKVWQALEAHDPSKRGMQNQTREEYVFMCVKNRVKDMLKKKVRPEDFIEDFAPTSRGEGARSRRERFEGRYLRHDEEAEVEAAMETYGRTPVHAYAAGDPRRAAAAARAEPDRDRAAARGQSPEGARGARRRESEDGRLARHEQLGAGR
jgi:hypothetical protein